MVFNSLLIIGKQTYLTTVSNKTLWQECLTKWRQTRHTSTLTEGDCVNQTLIPTLLQRNHYWGRAMAKGEKLRNLKNRNCTCGKLTQMSLGFTHFGWMFLLWGTQRSEMCYTIHIYQPCSNPAQDWLGSGVLDVIPVITKWEARHILDRLPVYDRVEHLESLINVTCM